MKPFIRCAGGKRALAPKLVQAFSQLNWHSYFEPFLGGGAVYFKLQETGALADKFVTLSDVNRDLIELYSAARSEPLELAADVNRLIEQTHKHGKEYYLKVRDAWNAGERSAARNLYLRKACFNGLWRENRSGSMNVPWRGAAPTFVDAQDLVAASRALRNPTAQLLCGSFQDLSAHIQLHALVYLDPPYFDESQKAFTQYTSTAWTAEQLATLLEHCAIWSDRGAHVFLSHGDTPQVRKLLAEYWPRATIENVQMRRAINSVGSRRGPVPEIIAHS